MRKKLLVMVVLLFTLLAAKATCRAAEILQQTNFDNGISLPWITFENFEENSYSKVVNGAYMVHINSHQQSREIWDIQIRHREFVIEKDHTYKVGFKVKATKPCKVRAKVADADEKYNWREFWFKEVSVGDSWTTVSDTFEANASYSIVEFALHFGGSNLLGNEDFDIFFDDFTLSDDQFRPTPTPIPTPKRDIRVNQLGYYPSSLKKATMVSNAAEAQNVQLRDSSGKVVWEGKSTPKSGTDVASGEKVHIIDFSDFITVGKGYYLVCGTLTSLPFDIGDDIYSKLKYDALKYFYYQRSGIDIKMPYCVDSKWASPAKYPDNNVRLYSNPKYKGPLVIDASGGWYEGDLNSKSISYGGTSTWQLQNLYERAAKKGLRDFEDNTMNIPESGNSYPDLLDEARWNINFYLNVQIPEGKDLAGMVVNSVSGVDENVRQYYSPTTYSTLNFTACTAQAARLWKQYDPEFADECLKASETAWKAALDNPAVVTGNDYNESEKIEEGFYWAACELFITTGKAEYLNYLKESKYAFNCSNELISLDGNDNFSYPATIGTIDLVLNCDVCKYNGLSSEEIDSARKAISSTADRLLEIQALEGYGVPLNVSDYTNLFIGLRQDGYPMASNAFIMNRSIVMAYAYEFTSDVKYLNGVIEAADYLMGRNPMVKCYVSGYGENPLKYPHHPYYCPQIDPSCPPVPPGFICGGPNSVLTDPWSAAGIDSAVPAQKSYADHVESQSTNDVSMAYNAPLAWLTSFLDVQPAKKSIDLNGDGVINMLDIMILAKAFGTTKADAEFEDKYDLNSDGAINMVDIMLVAAKYNTFVE